MHILRCVIKFKLSSFIKEGYYVKNASTNDASTNNDCFSVKLVVQMLQQSGKVVCPSLTKLDLSWQTLKCN
jgi:hypothetical protein